MRQSQIEIKTIEAELRSIRADTKSSSRSVSLLNAGGTSDEPAWDQPSPEVPQAHPTSIAPTIVPRTTRRSTKQNHPQDAHSQPKPKREVECFPISSQTSTQTQADVVSQAQLAAVIEQLRQGSSSGKLRQSEPGSRRTADQTVVRTPKVDTIQQQLVEKAEHVNYLSTQQEKAILELMRISGQLDREYDEIAPNPEHKSKLSLGYQAADIPYVERNADGILILTNRPIASPRTPAKAPRQQVRHQHRHSFKRVSLMARIWHRFSQPIVWTATAVGNGVGDLTSRRQPQTAPRRKASRDGRRVAPPVETPVTLKQAALLVVGAALLRLFLDWVVVGYPMLWIPSVLVMIMPAVFAIYRATVKPPSGFAWGYRLFAILIGLLLGGRL